MRILIITFLISLIVFLNPVLSQDTDRCIAGFSYEIDVNTNIVGFTNTSIVGSAEDYELEWSFHGAVILSSNEDKPKVQYREEGVYPVCLTIYTGYCTNTICKDIYIKKPAAYPCELEVEADIYNESYPGYNDGLISLSVSGGLGEYYYNWSNYDDSEITEGLQPGEYCVYITDGGNCSKDTCFVIEPALQCEADFFHLHDDECSNCIYFYDNSYPLPLSVEWDFGDGSFSNNLNPAHYFEESGIYHVCLTVYTGGDCVDTHCQDIYVIDSLFEMYGYVFAGDYYLPEGVVILFKENEDNSYSAIDYSIIDDYGGYYFDDLTEANYLTYAIPYFDLGYVFTPIYLPTYYGDALYWQDASNVYLNDDFYCADIFLSSYDTILYGEGSISGELLCVSQSSYEGNVYSVDWFNTGISTGNSEVVNMPVLLLDESGQAIDYRLSDENAGFSFENLENMTYQIYTEKAGMETHPLVLTIDNETSDISGVQILIGDSEISSVYDDLYSYYYNQISVYPNPVSDFVFIKFDEVINNDVQISITNSLGQQILTENIENVNADIKVIDVSTLNSGVYILNVIIENRLISKKIIK